MLIFKSCRGGRHLFDTDYPNWADWNTRQSVPSLNQALQYHIQGEKIRDYLSQFFLPEHPIFLDFGDAYFYKYEPDFNQISRPGVPDSSNEFEGA